MDHFYKYEGMREEDRNGLIPFMHVPEALRIDPEDSGRSNDSQEHKQRPSGTVGSGKAYQRKTRDVYMLLDDTGEGGMNPTGEWYDNWPDMREALEDKRKAYPRNRYSYRKKRIRIEQQ